MELEIVSSGLHNYVTMTIQSIAMLFSHTGVAIMTGGLFLLYFLVMVFRSTIDDKQPSPLKEALLFLFLYVIFATPNSPKVRVVLTSSHNATDVSVVDDVPFIVAFPYWVANKFSQGLIESTALAFDPVDQVALAASSPMQAILKLYNQPPPNEIVLGGQSTGAGYDLKRTIKVYMVNCYFVDQELDGAEPVYAVERLRKTKISADFIETIRVDFNGIYTTVWLNEDGSAFGLELSCPQAHDRISNAIVSNAPALQTANMNSGITSQSIRSAMQIMTGQLSSGISAYDLQVGLFTAKMVRDGFAKTTFETELDLMVFQASRERMMSKVAEQGMFEQISMPVITFLECLIFFLTPLYVILLALGSKGVAHMAKYFMLIIFVSFWQYMNIYVEFYQYMTVRDVLQQSEGFDPFSFDSMPFAIGEIEGALATAASATQVIPFLLMFLMYGGVHSLMGAMRGLTDVKASGKMAAPDITSAQSNGSRNLGDMDMTRSITGEQISGFKGVSNASEASINISSASVNSMNRTATESSQLVEAKTEAFNQAANKMAQGQYGISFDQLKGGSRSEGLNETQQNMASWAEDTANTYGISTSQAASLAAGYDVKAGFQPFGLGASLNVGETLKSVFGEDWKTQEALLAKEVDSFAKTYSVDSKLTTTSSGGEKWAETQSEARSELLSAGQSLQAAKTVQEAVAQGSANQDSLSTSVSLNFNGSKGLVSLDEGRDIHDQMMEAGGESYKASLMEAFGTTDFDEIRNNYASDRDVSIQDGTKGTAMGALNTIVGSIMGDDIGADGKAETAKDKVDELNAFGVGLAGIADAIGDSQLSNPFRLASEEVSEAAIKQGELLEKMNGINTEAAKETKDIKNIVKNSDGFGPVDTDLVVDKKDFNPEKIKMGTDASLTFTDENLAESREQRKTDFEKGGEKIQKALDESAVNKIGLSTKLYEFQDAAAETDYNDNVGALKSAYMESFKRDGSDYNTMLDSRMFDDIGLLSEKNLSTLSDGELFRAFSVADYVDKNIDDFKDKGIDNSTLDNIRSFAEKAKDEMATGRGDTGDGVKGWSKDTMKVADLIQEQVSAGNVSSAGGARLLSQLSPEVTSEDSSYNNSYGGIDGLDLEYDKAKLNNSGSKLEGSDHTFREGLRNISEDYSSDSTNIDRAFGNNHNNRSTIDAIPRENSNYATTVASTVDYRNASSNISNTGSNGNRLLNQDRNEKQTERINQQWKSSQEEVGASALGAYYATQSTNVKDVDDMAKGEFYDNSVKAVTENFKEMRTVASNLADNKPNESEFEGGNIGTTLSRFESRTDDLFLGQVIGAETMAEKNGAPRLDVSENKETRATRIADQTEKPVSEVSKSPEQRAYTSFDTAKGEVKFDGIYRNGEQEYAIYSGAGTGEGFMFQDLNGDGGVRPYNSNNEDHKMPSNYRGGEIKTIDDLKGADNFYTSPSNDGIASNVSFNGNEMGKLEKVDGKSTYDGKPVEVVGTINNDKGKPIGEIFKEEGANGDTYRSQVDGAVAGMGGIESVSARDDVTLNLSKGGASNEKPTAPDTVAKTAPQDNVTLDFSKGGSDIEQPTVNGVKAELDYSNGFVTMQAGPDGKIEYNNDQLEKVDDYRVVENGVETVLGEVWQGISGDYYKQEGGKMTNFYANNPNEKT